MNSLAFIASVVGSLAVPATILVFLVLFRRPVTELLGRIISYEGLGQKVNFGQKLAGAEKSVSRAVAQAQESVERTQLNAADVRNIAPDHALWRITSAEQNSREIDLQRAGLVELAELATSNPSFVVLKGWEDLEAALRELVEVAWPGTRGSYPFRRLQDLVGEGYVDATLANAVRDVRGLRNNVAHGQHNPTAGEAVTYLESTRDLARIARATTAYLAGRRAAEETADRIRVAKQSDRASE